jgi:hypothetical protein
VKPFGAGEIAVTSLTSFGVVCADRTNVRHTGSLDAAIRLACELERAGHTVADGSIFGWEYLAGDRGGGDGKKHGGGGDR